jgi:3-oxoacyl-[acyl-carrier protein] reductase
MDLSGRNAIVTGASGGIGAATAKALGVLGARVVVTYHSRPADETVAAIVAAGTDATAVKVDAIDSRQVQRAVDEAIAFFGAPLHILVNNIGSLLVRAPVVETTDAQWRAILDLNLTSCFHFSRAAIPHMTGGWGRIVNVSSMSARNGGGPNAAVYAAAKAGVEGLTRALAKELASQSITVNAVSPGYVAGTAQVSRFIDEKAAAELPALTLVGRAGRPEDIAAAITLLASDAGGYVSGEVIQVNGGRYFA